MNAPTVVVAGASGVVFEGETPDTFCFVPQQCVREDNGKLRVDEIDYVKSGWDVKNVRFSNPPFGNHLFPNSDRVVQDLEQPAVRGFLDRIRRLVTRTA